MNVADGYKTMVNEVIMSPISFIIKIYLSSLFDWTICDDSQCIG